MVTHLDLGGGELAAYALVHQFSQSEAGIYTGGVPYLAAWLKCSTVTARKYLHALEAKGLIKSIPGNHNGVPFRNYQVIENHIPKNFEDTPKKIEGDTKKSFVPTPKNFEIDNKIDNKLEYNLPPTPQEVADYVRSRGFADPEGFADYFLEVMKNDGWRMNHGEGAPVKNWKNYIVSSWERRHKNDVYTRAASIAGMKTFDLSRI